MKKVLIIGAQGQLGTELCGIYSDWEVHKADLDGNHHLVDITRKEQVAMLVNDVEPELVINTAAAHNVPECEEHPDHAFAVNAIGTRNIALACKKAGARFMHMSTDYVFGDGGKQPYVETDLPAPLNVYAASKLAGEHLIAAATSDYIIVRTAAIYGMAECRAKGGKNFVGLMLNLAATRPDVRVVTDEYTTPTYTLPLAKQMRILAEKANPGLYHVTCGGSCSWFEFAQAIFEETGTETNLVSTTSVEFQSPVRRPSYSVLENRNAADQGLDNMPHWRDALVEYLKASETLAS